jgi:hypothetical protein
MADTGTVVRIKADGAPLGALKDKVWAFLLEETGTPVDWVITPAGEGVQLADRASGAVLAVPSTEPFTQATLAAQGATNSRWTLGLIDGFDYTPVTTVTEPGWYCLALAGTGQFLGRNRVEDRSLMPKKVLLLPEGVEPPRLLVEVVG